MKHFKLLLVPSLVALITLVAAPAEAAATHITPKIWHVYTSDDVKHNVALGGTYMHCLQVDEIYLKVRVTNAHKGASFKEIWFFNGEKQTTATDTWNKNGTFTDYFGQFPSGGNIPDGVWKVKLAKAGKTLAQSHITLQSTC